MRRYLFAFVLVLPLFWSVPTAALAQGDRWGDDDRDGVHVSIFRSYRLPAGRTESRAVIVIGGSAVIDGTVDDDVVVLAGSVRVGPQAHIAGDLVHLAGTTNIDPSARIDGAITRGRIGGPDWNWAWDWPSWPEERAFWSAAFMAFTIGRFALVAILSLLLVGIAPGWIDTIAGRVDRTPGVSAAAGLAAEILSAPALLILCLALVISIVGIPLLLAIPILLCVLALAWIAGYTAVAGFLGARLRGVPYGRHGTGAVDVIIGSLALAAPTIVGRLLTLTFGWLGSVGAMVSGAGTFVEWMAWTLGLGAALLALWNGPARDRVPPLMTPSPAPNAM